MKRIPLFLSIENLFEIFSMDRSTDLYYGIKRFISNESEIKICLEEEEAYQYPLFGELAKEFSSGDFIISFLDNNYLFLSPPFKTNLQEHFQNKSSIFFSHDSERINLCYDKNGLLIGTRGQEIEIYQKLNLKKNLFRGETLMVIGNDFNAYDDIEQYLMPFAEIIINEPYLFVPEKKDFDLNKYLENNFNKLIDMLFKNVKNKVNIVITTFVNEHNEHESRWYDRDSKSFQPLFDYIKNYLKNKLGGARFKLWLVISPGSRNARHDRYILTNYQYIESPSGFTFFDHRGEFINRGESLRFYTILHDDYRNRLMPSIINQLQSKVITSVKSSHPNRIFYTNNENSYYFNFT